jgi:hypothetical protein
MKLQTQLEIRTRELELMESQKDSLYKENQDLKAEQVQLFNYESCLKIYV